MPLKRQPKTLFKHCIEMSIYAILMEWRDRYNADDSVLFSNIIPVFPPSVLNSLVSDVIDIFVQTVNSHDNSELKHSVDGSLADLLECVLSERLTLLDLSPLARLETIAPMEVVKSEKIILKSLVNMSNLVSLSFKANRSTPTVPFCGDELLKEIGFNCPKLKSLDVSYNHTVTNVGLQYLWEHPFRIISGSFHHGCPELKKLIIFGCAVTSEGVSNVLEYLKMLQFVGYKETGLSLMLLNKNKISLKLNLVYLNNMGCGMKSIEDLNKLHYSCKMSHIVCKMCPYINELKVRVTDATLEHVILGPNINSVHLIFDIGKQLAVGRGVMNLIKNYGAQLTTLSLICSTISTDHLLKIGDFCKSLETFTIKCGQLHDPKDILFTDFKKHNTNKIFCNLENLFFTVLTNTYENVGIRFLPFIVNSTKLKNFYFSANSNLFSNSWVEDFLTFFDTKCLETFVIDVPTHVFSHATLTLTMASVDHVIAKCPQIKTIGNLFAWCISVEEMKELCRLRELENSDLDFIYHPVPVHMNFQNYH